MKPREGYAPLPPLRKKVFRHSLQIVGLYVVVGGFMMVAVFLASGTTPKAIHLNYDSISAAMKMNHAWVALRSPELHPQKPPAQWAEQFEKSIRFEESNVTEPGEGQLAKGIRTAWDLAKENPQAIDRSSFEKMEDRLDQLVAINENGMFGWAARSNAFSRNVFIVTVVVFFLTILIALYLADGLAIRISEPLRMLSERLRRKPEPGSKLKLPEPNSLEMRILQHELLELWDRVTELQKLNVEQIVSQRQQLATVLASVDDAILVLNNQEQVIHCNEGMLRILGMDFQEVTGKPWRDLSSMGENYLKLRRLLNPEVSSDKVVEIELGGKQRAFSGRCRAILDEKGQAFGRLYLLHDITEIRHKDRLKTEFIGVLSHELKTPLQSLSTASELLLQKADGLDAEGKMLVETVHEDVGRIRGVANEFIQVGLIDLHSLRLKMGVESVSGLMEQWIRPFQVLAKDRGVKIEFVKEGCETISARIDTVKFPWAITNLLSNAIRVSQAGNTVTVYMTDREKRVDIEVRDEGPGIPEEIQKRMFDPFFQGGQFPGDKTSGFLGLGLTITKEVVEAHEGEIHYYPREPHGSIFKNLAPPFDVEEDPMAVQNDILKVLLVDDDVNICRTLALSLKSFDCEVVQAHSVPAASERLKEGVFDLILTDFRMGEKTGTDLIREARKSAPNALIAVMTAFASIGNAIEVTREGAFDYLAKPFTRAQLEHLLKKVRLVVSLRKENENLRRSEKSLSLFSGMTSVANQRLEEFVKKVAPTEATLLLVGESGTGKTALAQFIHQNSGRAAKPFVVVNCTSLAESLLESEIFGHTKGSFTGAIQDKPGKFELAHHGTLFLDEIGDLSLGAQSKLLRFLQEKVIERVGSNQTVSVDARVIAATHRNLEEAVADGTFREDLYYRLNVFECALVPVRHRKEDLPLFFQRFAKEFALSAKQDHVPILPAPVLELLCRYDWPGNVREIRNVMERLILLSAGREIHVADLPEKIVRTKPVAPGRDEPLVTLEEATKRHIERVLQAEPNLDKAAEILGITKVTLWRRRKEYGLP